MGETNELKQLKDYAKQQPARQQGADALKVIKHLKESISALHEENAILKTLLEESKGDN